MNKLDYLKFPEFQLLKAIQKHLKANQSQNIWKGTSSELESELAKHTGEDLMDNLYRYRPSIGVCLRRLESKLRGALLGSRSSSARNWFLDLDALRSVSIPKDPTAFSNLKFRDSKFLNP